MFKLDYFDKKTLIITSFVAAILISNLLTVKLCDTGVFGIVVDCGTLLFPLTYLLSDVVTEAYGERTAKRTIYLGFLFNLLLVIFTQLSVMAPYPAYFDGQGAYAYVFSFAPRILAGSLLAYLCGQYVNMKLMIWIKEWTQGKHLFLRTIGSSIGGEWIDSLIFVTIVFYGTMPLSALCSVFVIQYVIKVLWEVVMQPLTYSAIKWAKKED